MGVGIFEDALGIDRASTELLLRHYATAGPLMERLLGAIPFVWVTLPRGVSGPPFYHGPLSDKTRPKAAVVDVATPSGVRRYPQLSTPRVEGLVRYGATEIYSWSPTPADPLRAAFARLLVEINPKTPGKTLIEALHALRGVLLEAGVGSTVVFDGGTGAAMWIPFDDGPAYDAVRVWLHGVCARAVERYPNLLTLEPNTHVSEYAHLHVATNAVGRFSAVPYTARASKGYPVAIPVPWDRVDSFENGSVRAGDLAAWLAENGETFGRDVATIGPQSFEGLTRVMMPAQRSRGPIIAAAIEVLQDGRPHSAQEILAIALERKLLGSAVSQKYVYTALIEYIARTIGNGRKPAVVQNGDRTFRLNEPPDEWPAVDGDDAVKDVAPGIVALCERLESTARGGDYAAFEQAVCDAFDALGFATTHVGGQKAPDGYADALLGTRGYRTTIECKSADEGVNDPHVFEAAKFKDAYGAQYCALVGRAFSGEVELTKELNTHGVSAWTIADLQTLLRIGANPLEMVPLFAPGFAADRLDDVLWERRHGRAKRVRAIADAIVRVGWETQAAYHGAPAEAPRLTEDVAMVLVDQDLAARGSAATCGRADVRAAIAYLGNPLVGLVERDPTDGSVVVLCGAPME